MADRCIKVQPVPANARVIRPVLGRNPRRNLNFDLHSWVDQTGLDHCGGRRMRTKGVSQHRPTGLKIIPVRQDIVNPNHIVKTRACLCQCSTDMVQRQLALIFDGFRRHHGFMIIAGGARHQYPAIGHNGPAVADFWFKC